MDSKQITAKQMIATICMFLFGSAFVVGVTSKAKQDTWITIIIGSGMALPMIFVYCKLIQKYPGENLYEIIIKLFGKTIGKVVCILYIWFFLHVGSMVIRIFTEFIRILNMPETPQIATICFVILLNIWSVRNGVENISRIAKTTFPVLASFIVITVIISFKDMNFDNIKPILSTDIQTILSTSYTAFAIPFSEMLLFIILFPYVDTKCSPKKIYLKSLFLSMLILLLAALRNRLVLGNIIERYYFPSYKAVSIISVGEFFTRIEVMIGSFVLLAGFIKVCVLLFVSSVGLANVCNIKGYKSMVAPCGLIMVVLAKVDYKNMPDMISWIDFHQIYIIPFEILIPITILITAAIKSRKKKSIDPPEPENMGDLE